MEEIWSDSTLDAGTSLELDAEARAEGDDGTPPEHPPGSPQEHYNDAIERVIADNSRRHSRTLAVRTTLDIFGPIVIGLIMVLLNLFAYYNGDVALSPQANP